MAVLKTEFHLWTLKSQMLIADTGLGFLAYHDKNEKGAYTGSSTSAYLSEKQQFLEARGKLWTPKNKRPERLRDSIKEFEEMLNSSSKMFSTWITAELIQIFLSNGTIFWITIDHTHGDLVKLTKDTSLVGKLSITNISDVVFSSMCMVVCSNDKSQIEIISYSKSSLFDNTHRRISSLEPKITTIDLPGRSGRSLNRHLQIHNDTLLIYWPTASEEAWPWAPISNDEERANLCVISITQGRSPTLCYTRTESDPINIIFSSGKSCENFSDRLLSMQSSLRLLSVERSISTKNPKAELCTYETTKSTIHRTQHTSVPLNSRLVLSRWDNSQNYLLLACEDNSLVLHSESQKITQNAQGAFYPAFASWHPTSCLFAVVSQKGSIQMFDRGLSCIYLTMEGIDSFEEIKLSNFFRLAPIITSIEWCNKSLDSDGLGHSSTNTLLVNIDRGPIGILKLMGGQLFTDKLTCTSLINEYLKSKHEDEAVRLLTSMCWDIEGSQCFLCLSNIVNTLLRQKLSRNSEKQLETALGCFYAPSQQLTELTILEYRTAISCLARRFFHHLLRYSRYDKAFLLAVDINSRDLFMDIYYSALDSNQPSLAAAAKQKAFLCEEEVLFSDSQDDSVQGDNISDEELGYSAPSSDDSIISPGTARIIMANYNNRRKAPPLPPRRNTPNGHHKTSIPPLPPRIRNSLLHHHPSSGDSTPPLPPRNKFNQSQRGFLNIDQSQRDNQNTNDQSQNGVTNQHVLSVSRYKHIDGITLPGGYSYELNSPLSHHINIDNLIIDEPADQIINQGMHVEQKPIKVIHFGLV